ncbi:MAG: hypothetical protein KF716_33955 [Anaerolineae bacterium]|nr:hypothetical protein [Anaerolineae bacterium]
MPHYNEHFRHRARIALQAAGYPTHYGALKHVSILLGVPRHTLKRWFHQPAPTADTILSTSLPPMLMVEVQKLFSELDRKREEASYAQLSRALTQLVDALEQVDSLTHLP